VFGGKGCGDDDTRRSGPMTAPLPPPPPLPPPIPETAAKKKPWWRRWWAITAAVVIVLAIIGAATGSGDKKKTDSATTATVSSAVPASSPPSTAAAVTTQPAPATAPLASVDAETAANVAWSATAAKDSDALVVILNQLSADATALDEAALHKDCSALIPVAQQFGDHAPDTDAGRHAQTAANLYVQASAACLAGDYNTATTLITQAGGETDKATAAIQKMIDAAS
jgi:hypothetical protein